MEVTSQIAFVLLDVCRTWTNKTWEVGRCEECDARRLERLRHLHKHACYIPVVDLSNSSFYIAFGAVQKVFFILSVLGLHVNLI